MIKFLNIYIKIYKEKNINIEVIIDQSNKRIITNT